MDLFGLFEALRKIAMFVCIASLAWAGIETLASQGPEDFVFYGFFFVVFLVSLIVVKRTKLKEDNNGKA